MKPNQPTPIVGVSACLRHFEERDKHMVDDKYVRAVAVSSEALPVIFPAMGDIVDPDTLLDRVDGIMLTGSPSNVHPEHYGAEACPKSEPHDRARDITTLPLIEAILAKGVPLLAVCRGFQEMNVALGGSLHVRVHEVAGRIDHRRPQHPDLDVQYGPSHTVSLTPDGQFRAIFGCEEFEVNSLHWQAIDRLAPGLVCEAVAPDGTIEGVRVEGAKAFAIGVQWHPEYKSSENPLSQRLFKAFGEAVRSRARARNGGASETGHDDALSRVASV
jgi:putative glutamine amidotransferase